LLSWGYHNRPFDATENRLIPVRLVEEIGFLVSIRRLVEAMESACKSLHPGSIPGEASKQFFIRGGDPSHIAGLSQGGAHFRRNDA
jgi:hypothetical protein